MTAASTLAAPAEPAPAPPAAPWRTRILPVSDPRGGWVATLVVAAIAGLLRFVRLDIPAGRIFDEIYYVCDAQNLLRYGVEHDTVDDDPNCIPEGGAAFVVHPPLGKWAIALGIRAFGVDELGWRFSAAVAGTLTVVVLVRLARRMTGSTLLACLAGLLLSLDGLHLVQSRVAMLDVFLVLWTTAAVGCLVADRDHVRRRLARTPDERLDRRLGLRPWLLAAGVCLGAAVSTKWSGLYVVAVGGLLALAWEVGARRTAGVARPVRTVLRRSSLPLVGALLLLPAVLYVASWTGWFLSDIGYDRRWAAAHPVDGVLGLVPDVLRSWGQYHLEIYRFHSGLSSPHPYQSHPAQWLLLARPVSYYYPQDVGAGDYGCTVAACSREVLAIGLPAIWWACIPMLVAVLWLWLARRDWRAATVLALVAATLLPWVREDLDGRTMFLFYALPALPFLCLGLALVAGWVIGGPGASLLRRRVGLGAVAAYVVLVVANLVWLYPVLAAQTLPYAEWRDRMWFTSWI